MLAAAHQPRRPKRVRQVKRAVVTRSGTSLFASIAAWASRTWAFDSANFLPALRPRGPEPGLGAFADQLGAVRLRDAGVADQYVSQTAVCDRRARTPSGTRRRVSYPVSYSMSCRRRANADGSENHADTPGRCFPFRQAKRKSRVEPTRASRTELDRTEHTAPRGLGGPARNCLNRR